LDRHARRRVELAERLAPTVGRTAGIDSTQFDHKLRQISGGLALVVDEVIAIGVAIDPAIDCPGEGIVVSRWARRYGLGDAQRKRLSELWQPVQLLFEILGPRGHAR